MLGFDPSIQGKRSGSRPWTLGSGAEGDEWDSGPLLHLHVELGEIRLRSRRGRSVRGDTGNRAAVVARAGVVAAGDTQVAAPQEALGVGGILCARRVDVGTGRRPMEAETGGTADDD